MGRTDRLQYIPGTKMAFAGLKKAKVRPDVLYPFSRPQDRNDLIT